MPLYELLCLAKPALSKDVMIEVIKAVGGVVYRQGGFVTQLKSYGDQHLAYDIRRPFEKYDQAHIWQLDFLARTASLAAIDHELRIKDTVLRWVIIKRPRLATDNGHAATRQHELRRLLTSDKPEEAPPVGQ